MSALRGMGVTRQQAWARGEHFTHEEDYMRYLNEGGGVECGQTPAKLVNPTLTESLQSRKVRLEEELAQLNEALAALKANPEIENLLNLIQKIR